MQFSRLLVDFSPGHTVRVSLRQGFLRLWRLCELLSAAFGLMGWVVATVDYEVKYAEDRDFWNCKQKQGEVLRWVDTILTLVSLLFLVLRHATKRRWKLKKQQHASRWTGKLKEPESALKLAVEVAILCVFPYPGVEGEVYIDERHRKSKESEDFIRRNICYTGSEVLYAIMFLRFFFVFRAAINLTSFMDGHSRKVCRLFDAKSNVRFAIRAMVRFRPFVLLVTFALPTALLASMLIRLFERPYVQISNQNFTDYSNTVYYTYISMTTIAYGDFYSWTELGRLVSILIGVWGMAVFSLMIYIIDTAIRTNDTQLRAFRAIRRTRIAAKFLDAFFYYALVVKRKATLRERIVAFGELRRGGLQFRRKMEKVTRLQALKEKERKEVHTKLEELEHVLTRVEIKAGALEAMESSLEKASSLLQQFASVTA